MGLMRISQIRWNTVNIRLYPLQFYITLLYATSAVNWRPPSWGPAAAGKGAGGS